MPSYKSGHTLDDRFVYTLDYTFDCAIDYTPGYTSGHTSGYLLDDTFGYTFDDTCECIIDCTPGHTSGYRSGYMRCYKLDYTVHYPFDRLWVPTTRYRNERLSTDGALSLPVSLPDSCVQYAQKKANTTTRCG